MYVSLYIFNLFLSKTIPLIYFDIKIFISIGNKNCWLCLIIFEFSLLKKSSYLFLVFVNKFSFCDINLELILKFSVSSSFISFKNWDLL